MEAVYPAARDRQIAARIRELLAALTERFPPGIAPSGKPREHGFHSSQGRMWFTVWIDGWVDIDLHESDFDHPFDIVITNLIRALG